jgi:hypothetical protein
MATSNDAVTLTREQVEELNRSLSHLRHNVNNHLSLIVAAAELVRRKPDMAVRMMTNLVEQPQKIVEEIRRFSDDFNRVFAAGKD